MHSPSDRLFDLVLALSHPPAIRHRDGAEMRRTFRERCETIRRRRGRLALLTHQLREIGGTIAAGIAARRAIAPNRPGRTRPTATRSARLPTLPSDPEHPRSRTGGIAHTMDSLVQDTRHAVRALTRQKALTAAALVTLALGIGANTAIFSVVYGVLLRPLPYAAPDRLVRISEEHPGANAPISGVLSDVTLHAWSTSMTTLEDIAAWSDDNYTVGVEQPERMRGAAVSPALFSLLRVAPVAGRFFGPEEAVKGAGNVVVIGHGLWQERFGGDQAAIGRTMVIEEQRHTIIGVAPRVLDFPAPETVLWRPYVMPPVAQDEENSSVRVFGAIGRLAPGTTPAQAAAEGTASARSVTRPFATDLLFGEGGPVEVRVGRLADAMTAEVRPALRVLAAGVAVVLLIACANVANLLLSHGMTRARELGVRSALGANRARLVRHLLTESLLVSVAGGVAGWLLAAGLVRLLPTLAPADFPRLDAVQLDAGTLAFAIAASLLAGVGAGLIPALRGAQAGISPSLHDGDARSTDGGRRLRAGLLGAEAALAVILVVAASLLVRSFVSMTRVDAGYDPTNVLIGQIHFSGVDQKAGRADELARSLVQRLEARSGVVAAAAANMIPFARATSISGFHLPPTEPEGEPVAVRANTWLVTAGFADALGLRVTEGRFLIPEDAGSGTQAMVVNEEFVRLFLTDGEPAVGRRYEEILGEEGLVTEIVGVVANVLKDGPTREPQPEIYLTAGDNGRTLRQWVFLVVRTTDDPLTLASDLRELVRQTAPLAALDGVGSLGGRMSTALAQPRFAAAVLGSFALLALTLAATGLYGVMSYNVTQRRRELGVRAALGAGRSALLRMVLRQGLSVAGLGLLIGLAGAAVVTRLMQGLLFGVEPLDPVAFSVAPAVLLLVAVLACLLPARRAAAADPATAFRTD